MAFNSLRSPGRLDDLGDPILGLRATSSMLIFLARPPNSFNLARGDRRFGMGHVVDELQKFATFELKENPHDFTSTKCDLTLINGVLT
jgi:hypothetical protein